MGGRISLKYAIENLERVNGLVLLCSSGPTRKDFTANGPRLMKNPLGRALIKRLWSRKMAKLFMDMVFDGTLTIDEEIDRMWDFSKYPGSMNAMFREFAEIREDFNSAEIEQLSTNTLLIWGEEDTICPISMGEWYDSKLANSVMVRLPNIGHLPQFECPEKCLEEMSSWLENLS